jgi:hypothetical protein
MQVFNDKTAPHQLPFEAYGVEMRICTNTPELLAEIERMMPPIWQRRPRSETQHRLGLLDEDHDMYSIYRDDGACVHDAPGRDYALVMMESQIHDQIASDSPDYIFVHAGVVGSGNRAILMPGMSFTGKTTLVRALVEAGAAYYSDEFAVLDETGRVHPYPRRLSVRQRLVGDNTTLTEPPVEYEVEQLGGTAGVEPLPVGLVIATRYRPRGEWHPREITGGAKALTLIEHALPAQLRPEQTMRYVTRAVAGAVTLEGERGDADEFAPLLLDALRAVA